MADDKSDRSLQQAMREAWLSVVSSAESELQKASHRLLEIFNVPEGASLGAELLARMRKNRADFERRVDDGVKAAVAKVRAPLDKELAALRARVEKLQGRIEERKQKRAQTKKRG